MRKKSKIIITLVSMVMCMVLFVWGVHAATSVSLKITSTVGFTATNVYVDVLGQVKRGASVDTAVDLEKPDDIPDAIYTYHKQNFTPITEGENIGRPSNAVTTDSIPDWIVGQVRFTEEEPVVVYEIKFTNYGQFAIKVTLTEEQFNITGGIEKDIDNQATEMFDRLVKQLVEKDGITEQLKATDQMAWVGAMNNIRNRAEEIVNTEVIYA